jgi:hypothetical protein
MMGALVKQLVYGCEGYFWKSSVESAIICAHLCENYYTYI